MKGFQLWCYILLLGILTVYGSLRICYSFHLDFISNRVLQYVYSTYGFSIDIKFRSVDFGTEEELTDSAIEMSTVPNSISEIPTLNVKKSGSISPSRRPKKRKIPKRHIFRSEVSPEKLDPSIERINDVHYEPLLFIVPPVKDVVIKKGGLIDTVQNRIDFRRSDWFEQFQYYRELLSFQSPMNETANMQWWKE